MAHEIATMIDGRNAMAYVGETPWHGLGQQLTYDAPLEVWAKESGLDFELETAPIQYGEDTLTYTGKNVMYRKDTKQPLGIVSDKYKIVQPLEVLEFFRDMVGNVANLETAGVLRDGANYWALAKMDGEFNIAGDQVNQYLLLASSADGTLATQARLTSVRVVCNNTLQVATGYSGKAEATIRHNSVYNPTILLEQLSNYNQAFKTFEETSKILASVKLSSKQALNVFGQIFGGAEENQNAPTVQRALALYNGEGIGADLESSKGTAWGALNAVTQLVDWETARSSNARLKNAWFGRGAEVKQRAVTKLLEAA